MPQRALLSSDAEQGDSTPSSEAVTNTSPLKPDQVPVAQPDDEGERRTGDVIISKLLDDRRVEEGGELGDVLRASSGGVR